MTRRIRRGRVDYRRLLEKSEDHYLLELEGVPTPLSVIEQQGACHTLVRLGQHLYLGGRPLTKRAPEWGEAIARLRKEIYTEMRRRNADKREGTTK